MDVESVKTVQATGCNACMLQSGEAPVIKWLHSAEFKEHATDEETARGLSAMIRRCLDSRFPGAGIA